MDEQEDGNAANCSDRCDDYGGGCRFALGLTGVNWEEMMVQNYVRPTIALLLASMACSHLSTSSVQLEAEKAALKEAADTFHSAAGSMDVDGLVSHYTTDVLLLPPGAKRMQGAEATREFLSGFAAIPGAKARFEDPRVVTVSRGGDIGYTFGDAVFSFDGPDGETVTQHVRELHLWEKQEDGSWKIIVDMWNSGTSPPTDSE